MLYSSHSCERCYVNRECMLVAAAAADNDGDPSLKRPHDKLIHHFTGHLNSNEFKYFLEWDRLIDLEAHTSNHHITKAWLMSSKERERSSGKCMSSLCLNVTGEPLKNHKEDDDSIVIELVRSCDSELTTALNELKFEIGSRVALSIDSDSLFRLGQQKNFAILRGTTIDVGNDFVVIRVGETDAKRIGNMKTAYKQSLRFRLDKDDFTAGIGILRQNLINFLTKDVPPFAGKLGLTQELICSIHERTKSRLPRLRHLIIHLREPEFDVVGNIFRPCKTHICIEGCNLSKLSKEYMELNADQQAAILKVS